MWPTLIRIGDFEITTFGLFMFLAFIVASAVFTTAQLISVVLLVIGPTLMLRRAEVEVAI